jgi:hypothetical protein
MLKSISFALIVLMAFVPPVAAEPPADLAACLKLAAQITKGADAKIKNEAEYARYFPKRRDLDSACGSRDFVGAEKIADEIRATFHLD